MTTITVEELRERLDEVIDRLVEGGGAVAVTRDGIPVVEMNPTPVAGVKEKAARRPWTEEDRAAYWAEWDRIGAEISKTWPEDVSAVDAVREQRRG